MELVGFVVAAVKSVAWVFVVPALVFWSVGIFNPAWSLPYTWRNVIAFWILFIALRAAVRAIQSPDWPEWISLE